MCPSLGAAGGPGSKGKYPARNNSTISVLHSLSVGVCEACLIKLAGGDASEYIERIISLNPNA